MRSGGSRHRAIEGVTVWYVQTKPTVSVCPPLAFMARVLYVIDGEIFE